MKDMRRLRATAVLSNIAFIGYGALNGLLPVLLLHLVLLPLNLRRLFEEKRVPQPVTPQPVILTRSKATLLAIEALQYGGAFRPQTQSVPLRAIAP